MTTDAEARRLLGELRVHQVELEMQNEELREARAQLERSERRHAELYDFAPSGYLSLDLGGRIVQSNLAAAEMLGMPRGQLAGSSLRCFVSAGDRAVLEEMLEAAGTPGSNTARLLTLDSSPPVVAQVRVALSGDGDEVRVAMLDVTEQRRLDEMKDRFTALASHELRTPLTSVAGFASTLVDRWDELADGQRQEFAHVIDQAAGRMIRIINDVLVLSGVNAGTLEVNTEVVDVAQLVHRVQHEHPGHELVDRCPDDVRAVCDPLHLHQALTNFVSNAIKYGEPPIEIHAGVVGDDVEIWVSDRGRGVPAHFVPHLFEEFAREASASEHEPGNGLGLAIVRRLVEAQDGTAWYEPAEPCGSRFGVRLPAG